MDDNAERVLQDLKDHLDDLFWRTIPDFPMYAVSRAGNVMNLTAGRVLKPCPDRKGYLGVNLYRNGGRRHTMPVHRLVCLAWIGPCPPGQQVRHLNNQKTDNRLTNLAYGTREDDYQDNVAAGTKGPGELNPYHRLTEAQAIEIHDQITPKSRGLLREVAPRFNVTQPTISNIRNEKKWRHLWSAQRSEQASLKPPLTPVTPELELTT